MSDPNQPEKAIVTVHGARELYETNFISKMDPYCIVVLGGQEYKTNVDSNGSTTPKWDQTFTFTYVGETTMRFKVMDKDKFTADDYVGMADVSLGPIIHGTRKYITEIQLSRKEGKTAGFLKVTIEFFPKKEKEEKPATPAPAPAAPAAAPAPAPAPQYAAPPAYQQYPNPYGYAAPAPAPYAPSPYGYAAPAPAPAYGGYHQAPPYGAAYPGYAPHAAQAHGEKKKKKKSKKKKSSSSSSSDSD